MILNEDQRDALTEIVNIGVGRGAASLNALVDQPVELRVPSVRQCRLSELERELAGRGEPLDTSVVQGFAGTISGRAMLAFPRRDGVTLARIIADADEADCGDDSLDFDLAGILEEIGNIVLNGVLGSLSNVFEDEFHYSVPELCTGSAADALTREAVGPAMEDEPTCLIADTRFGLAKSAISGSLLLAFNTGELSVLLDRLLAAVSA